MGTKNAGRHPKRAPANPMQAPHWVFSSLLGLGEIMGPRDVRPRCLGQLGQCDIRRIGVGVAPMRGCVLGSLRSLGRFLGSLGRFLDGLDCFLGSLKGLFGWIRLDVWVVWIVWILSIVWILWIVWVVCVVWKVYLNTLDSLQYLGCLGSLGRGATSGGPHSLMQECDDILWV